MSNSTLVARKSAVADPDEDLHAQRIGHQRIQLLFAAAAGVAGLSLSETGVQRRPTL
jgi:hypothetical protein